MSNSKVYFDRFHARRRLRRAVAVSYVTCTLAYLVWRVTTINDDAFVLSIIYFLAEVLGFLLALTLIFCSWNYRHRTPPPALKGASVDVFVLTYREPVELVRSTLVAATRIDYPHQTFLLDDGNRPEMKALADEVGAHYLARDRNVHAKAGNLNHGLAHSAAEFVMVFDADHIALPHALEKMLGFFRDGCVAMVQTPQDYYNTNAFQFINARNGALWHDQSFFYGIAQACRDSFDAASCVGTGVIYRRAAIDAIGGIPVATVTEDFHTSLKLLKAGYRVAYLNEPIAYGVAASDLRDYYRTRHRWAHGNIHTLRVERIFTCAGLTLNRRLSYLTSGLIYLEGWQQLMLFVVPWMALFFGWAPFEITVLNVLGILLYPLLATLLLQELGCGLSRYWVNEIFAVARFPVHILASLALFSDSMRFRSSTKNIRGRIDWQLLIPQIVIFAVSVAALATGITLLLKNYQVGPLWDAAVSISSGQLAKVDWNQRLGQGYTFELVAVSGFWALFNAAKCLYLIGKVVIDAKRSTDDYRFDIRLPMELTAASSTMLARVNCLSLAWLSAQVYGDKVPDLGERLKGRLYLPFGVLNVSCRVQASASSSGTGSIECELIWSGQEDRNALAETLHSIDWHREFLHRNAYFLTPFAVLGRLLLLRHPGGPAFEWHPALYRVPETGKLAYAIVGTCGAERTAAVLIFRAMQPGRVIEMQVLDRRAPTVRMVRILQSEALRSLGAVGLDGAIIHRYRAALEQEWPVPLRAIAAE